MAQTIQQAHDKIDRFMAFANVIAEAIEGLGSVPSGVLYANLMGHMTLAEYDTVIDVLVRTKLVRRSSHLLTWIGPKTGGGQ